MKNNALILILLLLAACTSSDRLIGESCREPITLNEPAQQIRSLSNDLEQLTSPALNGRKTGSEGAVLTRQYLQQRFKQLGLAGWQDKFQHSFEYTQGFSDRQGINLAVMLPAADDTDNAPWRLVLAHYDHLGGRAGLSRPDGKYFPGADDNASGVAAMLSVAESLKKQALSANVLMVFTDAEEPGLYGSKALVRELQNAGVLSQIELVINLDMVGRPDKHRRLYVEGIQSMVPASRYQVLQQLQLGYQTIGLCSRVGHPKGMGRGSFVSDRIDWLRASDHYPFHKKDIPWLFFASGNHNQYHTEQDSIDRLDLNFIHQVSQLTNQLITQKAPLAD
ncbi:M20/M25/M40 family metallo-hydrolase [Shewanella corallii]|uniref:M20/M25/M40 family metallo-hydrolase n=1 Tax=Shewanella corallii TaxID=560080 RepID=A0ABT0N1N5_9GAMM|nr:M20/M25/M40 family metallo-hydrolase [Shewanella corallii]MCL2912357.1 M20/M25/M40 family metallo-hydrolase [Shewanella corallii]